MKLFAHKRRDILTILCIVVILIYCASAWYRVSLFANKSGSGFSLVGGCLDLYFNFPIGRQVYPPGLQLQFLGKSPTVQLNLQWNKYAGGWHASFPLLPVAVIATACLIFTLRRARSGTSSQCPQCQYDMRSLYSSNICKCPECGFVAREHL